MGRTIPEAPTWAQPDLYDFDLFLRARRKSAKTRRTYTEAAVWFAQRTDASGWLEVTTRDIRAHQAWLGETYSPAYASNQFRALQAFWKWYAAENDVPSPIRNEAPPEVPPKLVPIFAPADIDRLLGTCGRDFNGIRDKALILLFASSGCRLAEIAALRTDDVNLKALDATVLGKRSRPRTVRFDAATGDALRRYLRARERIAHGRGSDALWVGIQGPMTVSGVAQVFRRRGKKAGIHCNPHKFRHNFSHTYLLNGGQETSLMSQCGWTSKSMVMRYGSSAASVRAAADYDRVMGG